MLSRAIILALIVVAVSAATSTAQTLQVAPLPRDGQLLVSFKLEQELTDEIRASIQSGMIVSFIYKVDLRRGSAVWFDRTLGSAEVRATVKYDSLTRQYKLARYLDGRMDDAFVTGSEDVAWNWVTSRFEKMPLFRSLALEPNGEYYVRVRAHTAPRNAAFVWPWQGDDVVGFVKFTFIR